MASESWVSLCILSCMSFIFIALPSRLSKAQIFSYMNEIYAFLLYLPMKKLQEILISSKATPSEVSATSHPIKGTSGTSSS